MMADGPSGTSFEAARAKAYRQGFADLTLYPVFARPELRR
jgi:hypothetical protein